MPITNIVNSRSEDKTGCQALIRSLAGPSIREEGTEQIFTCTKSSGRNRGKHLGQFENCLKVLSKLQTIRKT